MLPGWESRYKLRMCSPSCQPQFRGTEEEKRSGEVNFGSSNVWLG